MIRKRWSGDTKKKALERPDAIAFEMTRMDDRISPCGSDRLAKNSVSEMCSAFRTWANRSESFDRKVDLAPTPGPGYSRVAEPVPGAAESVSVMPRWSSSARSPNQSVGDTPMRFSVATLDLPLPGLASEEAATTTGGDVSSVAAPPASLASAEGPAASDMVRNAFTGELARPRRVGAGINKQRRKVYRLSARARRAVPVGGCMVRRAEEKEHESNPDNARGKSARNVRG